jgi:hypothetical protein
MNNQQNRCSIHSALATCGCSTDSLGSRVVKGRRRLLWSNYCRIQAWCERHFPRRLDDRIGLKEWREDQYFCRFRLRKLCSPEREVHGGSVLLRELTTILKTWAFLVRPLRLLSTDRFTMVLTVTRPVLRVQVVLCRRHAHLTIRHLDCTRITVAMICSDFIPEVGRDCRRMVPAWMRRRPIRHGVGGLVRVPEAPAGSMGPEAA